MKISNSIKDDVEKIIKSALLSLIEMLRRPSFGAFVVFSTLEDHKDTTLSSGILVQASRKVVAKYGA